MRALHLRESRSAGNTLDLECRSLELRRLRPQSGKACLALWSRGSLGHGGCACACLGVPDPGHRPRWSAGPLCPLTTGLERAQAAGCWGCSVEDGHAFSSPALIAQASFESTMLAQTRQSSLGISRLTSFLLFALTSVGKERQQVSNARKSSALHHVWLLPGYSWVCSSHYHRLFSMPFPSSCK